MYISYKWLQDFIKLPSKVDYKQVAASLINHTVEVEAIKIQADSFANVVVGRVLSVKSHPNADRLKIALVDVGDKELQIVCGAPNIAAEQLVPVALVGAILPGDFVIKTSKIRGEVSEGMVCAEDELGLGSEHDGIMVLDKKAKVGDNFATYLKTDDIIFEIDNKSLSNRPDLLNHYGLAREISAIHSLKLKPYKEVVGKEIESLPEESAKLSVEVVDKIACPRYMALRIENITVEDSPAWLKNRLIAINQKPVNNIVDLANYVMFECGQPLHTFDGDKIKKIFVKNANANDIVETIDGKERALMETDLVISDGKKTLAIAGIMGSADSQINNNSNSLILEVANFKAEIIRKTAQRLNLRTDASVRFDKALDPNLVKDALHRFTNLLIELCPEAKIVGAPLDIYSQEMEAKVIDIKFSWLFKKIGQEIPKEKVLNYLKYLGFEVEDLGGDAMRIIVPTWRATKDIRDKEDIVEEVLRMYGYDNIESRLPVEELSLAPENKSRKLEYEIKDNLSYRFALNEIHNYSFVGEDQLSKLNIDYLHHLRIAKPLSELNSMLRQSLSSGLIYNIKNNQAKADSLGFYEIGDVFFKTPGKYDKGGVDNEYLPYQEKRVGVVVADKGNTFTLIKNIVSNFLGDVCGTDEDVKFISFENAPGFADEKIVAQVSLASQDIGFVCLLSQSVASNLNIKLEVSLAELNFDKIHLIKEAYRDRVVGGLAKYPAVLRDVCFVVSDKILYNDIYKLISSFNPLIKKVEIFDVYSGDRLKDGEKSLAFHLSYQDPSRTLSSLEVDEIEKELLLKMSEKFEARLRNF